MNATPILYLGDTALSGAAAYLAGLMTHWKFGFDYVPSDVGVSSELIDRPRKLFVISDYPSKLISPAMQKKILEKVSAGAGLMMIGGWESYHGLGGDWDGTPIGDALPVTIERTDDRVNCDQPAMLLKLTDHPAAGDLPWNDRPPTVGGFNRITPKTGATQVLSVQRFSATYRGESFDIKPTTRAPMLVAGSHGKGRTLALATDLAPHWVGGLVDWGTGRVNAKAEGAGDIEVGSEYAKFVRNMLSWTGQL